MDLWTELKKLEGFTFQTLKQKKKFEVIVVTDSLILIKPQARGKERSISRKEVEGSYHELVASRQISRSQIEDRYSPRNSAFVAALLAQLAGVDFTDDPITLYYR